MIKIKINKITTLVSIIILSSFSLSCTKHSGKELGLLPKSKGGKGEMLVVMDSVKWNGQLGDKIKDIFASGIPGLLNYEPSFSVRYIEPHKWNNILKEHNNIVVVTTFDSNTAGTRRLMTNFTPESVSKLKTDPSLYMLVKENEFARGQNILHLFGENEMNLLNNLEGNEQKLRDFFNKTENIRIAKKLFKDLDKELMEALTLEHSFSLNLPDGFRIAKNINDQELWGFIWYRFPEVDWDKNIFIHYEPYRSESAFENDSILARRDSIARNHIFGNPDNENSYVKTEPLLPPGIMETSINSSYSKEMRGWWKTNNNSMGGPFLSYTFVDESQGRIYYIEGFIFAPGKDFKREYVREMEIVLKSFKATNTTGS